MVGSVESGLVVVLRRLGSGGRTCTCDLWGMNPASYSLLHSAINSINHEETKKHSGGKVTTFVLFLKDLQQFELAHGFLELTSKCV